MNCPPEIATILTRIVTFGLVQARAAGWSGDAARAALEADHVHNLPRLISEFDPDSLAYYWEAERASYLNQADPESASLFEPLWHDLRIHISALSVPAKLG